MSHLKVLTILSAAFLLQVMPSIAASLHVARGEKSGVITALLRHPKTSHSVPRGLHIRQGYYCPTGYMCPDGESFLYIWSDM
jgi:hypothetical protein